MLSEQKEYHKKKRMRREERAEPIEAKGDNHMMVDQVIRFLKLQKGTGTRHGTVPTFTFKVSW
jgi:hypothetical protein